LLENLLDQPGSSIVMARLIQPAASASDWNQLYLESFKIKIEEENDSTIFFEVAELPDPATVVSDAILTATKSDKHNQDRETYRFVHFIELVADAESLEFTVDDFAVVVLTLMVYDPPGFTVSRGANIGFRMGSKNCSAQPDVCVMDDEKILLVFQEDKRHAHQKPVPQLMAEAIAAFCKNNQIRKEMKLPLWTSRMMYGISMYGTCPTFYKIPITQHLVDCVEEGVSPDKDTEVSSYVPVFPSGMDKGMMPLDNRRNALQAYLAFRALVFRDYSV
jgi:hypothetical protein